MWLLLLAVSLSAAHALPCPEQCDCGVVDELEYYCRINNASVSFNGRTNEYVNIKCTGTNFTCSDLPTINFANNLPLPSLGITGCSPAILRCVNQVLQTPSVSYVILTNTIEPLVEEDVKDLGEVHDLMIRNGTDSTIPVPVLKALPTLQSFRISGTRLTLQTDAFMPSVPIEFLELSADKISALPDGAFDGLNRLTILHIWGNNFTDIGVNSFKGLDSLETLTLNMNQISNIAVGSFAHTPKLKSILSYGNELWRLPTGLFNNLTQLENITIQANYLELKLESQSISNLPSLKILRLESSKIKYLPEDLLTGNDALQTLSLSYNEISSLPPKFFSELKSLEKLDLSFNKIESLTSLTFSMLKQLKSLNLNRNYLEVLPDFLFSGLRKLEYVSIDHNFLTTISPSTFQGATELHTVSLMGNKLTLKSSEQTELQQYFNFEQHSPFNTLTSLRKLILSGNLIDTIFEDWRTVLLQLKELDLSWNSYTGIDMYDVQFLSNNITVDLRHNNISVIRLSYPDQSSSDYQSSPSTITSGSLFLIDNNPLTCDCGIYSLAMRIRGVKPFTVEPKFVVGDVKCASPFELKDRLFRTVSPYDLNCDLEDEDCPKNCSNCLLRPSRRDMELDCLSIPSELPKPQDFGVDFLTLKIIEVPQSIEHLNVQTLNLSYLGLEHIPFRPTVNVTTIDFSNNNLTRIPLQFLESNTTLYLSNNSFECQCWYSDEISVLQKSVLVKDLDDVTCRNGDKIMQVDVVALCSSWRAAAVASGTFILLALIVVICVIIVYRYNNEILVYITSNGLFPCLFVEDLTDINKEFDVFVCYAHKDLKYFRKLLPKLENDFQQKTCVHYRDWYVGDLIPEQINRSVESSRKTLILLSANFLESPYTSMEFRAAHNLALKEGKNRVILILLEDVTKHEKLTDELKAYISTNTYLTWDDPRFWERLQRALPRQNPKKFVWPEVFKQAGEKSVKNGLDVHMNSDGKLVNVAVKDTV